jgi:hypothetical protein
LGKQSGGDGAVPFQAEIQCECAFTYMNAVFRKNLTDARAVDVNGVDTASDTSGALGDGGDRARFCRTTATRIWGVSDPRQLKHGAVIGGWQRGSPHAPDAAFLEPIAALTVTRAGTERRPMTQHRNHRLRRRSPTL